MPKPSLEEKISWLPLWIQRSKLFCGCFFSAGNDPLVAVVIGSWGSNQQRKINNISDHIGTEEAGRFLNLLQVLRDHAQRK